MALGFRTGLRGLTGIKGALAGFILGILTIPGGAPVVILLGRLGGHLIQAGCAWLAFIWLVEKRNTKGIAVLLGIVAFIVPPIGLAVAGGWSNRTEDIPAGTKATGQTASHL